MISQELKFLRDQMYELLDYYIHLVLSIDQDSHNIL